MKAKLAHSFFIVILVSCLFIPSCNSTQDQSFTDEEKKKIVYEMYAGYREDFKNVADIAPLDAMKLLEKGKAVFVDVRWKKEMVVSMLPNAVTRREFLKNQSRFDGQKVIGYCTISYRSGKFAQKMAKKGIKIHNLQGGILAWVHEGGSIYDKDGETLRIHVFGKTWNYPPDGYEAIW